MPKLKDEDRCPNCQAWHGIHPLQHLSPCEPCAHDPVRPCDFCGEPVGGLSMGGQNICSYCDCDPEHPIQVRFQRFVENCQEVEQ